MINPKNYPHWNKIVEYLKTKGYKVIQIGIEGEEQISGLVDEFYKNLPFKEIENLIIGSHFWMSVDNFLPHLVANLKPPKKGIVIFGTSDPRLFGYEFNINIIKSFENLRPNQFLYWFYDDYNPDVFPSPEDIYPFIDLFD